MSQNLDGRLREHFRGVVVSALAVIAALAGYTLFVEAGPEMHPAKTPMPEPTALELARWASTEPSSHQASEPEIARLYLPVVHRSSVLTPTPTEAGPLTVAVAFSPDPPESGKLWTTHLLICNRAYRGVAIRAITETYTYGGESKVDRYWQPFFSPAPRRCTGSLIQKSYLFFAPAGAQVTYQVWIESDQGTAYARAEFVSAGAGYEYPTPTPCATPSFPFVPVLFSPVEGDAIELAANPAPVFGWYTEHELNGFNWGFWPYFSLQVSDDPLFRTSLMYAKCVSTPGEVLWAPGAILSPGTTYYWRVNLFYRDCNWTRYEIGPWSSTGTFRTLGPTPSPTPTVYWRLLDDFADHAGGVITVNGRSGDHPINVPLRGAWTDHGWDMTQSVPLPFSSFQISMLIRDTGYAGPKYGVSADLHGYGPIQSWYAQMGLHVDGRNVLPWCQAYSYNSDTPRFWYNVPVQVGFDEWHSMRIDVVATQEGWGFAFRYSLDGREVAFYQPPDKWDGPNAYHVLMQRAGVGFPEANADTQPITVLLDDFYGYEYSYHSKGLTEDAACDVLTPLAPTRTLLAVPSATSTATAVAHTADP